MHRGVALAASALAPDGIAIILDTIPEQERISYEDYVLHRTWDEFTAAFGEAGLVISPTPQSGNAFVARHAGARASAAERYASTRAALAGEAKGAVAKTIDLVREKFGHLPCMTYKQATKIEEFIKSKNLANCLELGFYHGKSSAFIACILRDLGRGHLTTIDLIEAKNLSPNIVDILSELNISDWVTYYYEPRSHTWRLMKLLEEDLRPRFDFCYIDGGHSWDVTGFGFLLVDRLLVPGGWVLFDDLDFTFSSMVKPSVEKPAWLARMTPQELETPQVRKVWELLVKSHPDYQGFCEDGQWGFAQKKGKSSSAGCHD